MKLLSLLLLAPFFIAGLFLHFIAGMIGWKYWRVANRLEEHKEGNLIDIKIS